MLKTFTIGLLASLILLITFSIKLVMAEEPLRWEVSRIVLTDWRPAFLEQLSQNHLDNVVRLAETTGEYTGILAAPYDTSMEDGLFAQGRASYSPDSQLLIRTAVLCVTNRHCLQHAVKRDVVISIHSGHASLFDYDTGDESILTVISFDPLVFHYDNIPGLGVPGTVHHERVIED